MFKELRWRVARSRAGRQITGIKKITVTLQVAGDSQWVEKGKGSAKLEKLKS